MGSLKIIMNQERPDIIFTASNCSELELADGNLRKYYPDHFNGFYDWLLWRSGQQQHLVGVRYTLLTDYGQLCDQLTGLRYTDVSAPVIDIFFTDERQFSDDLSGHQMFCDDYVYFDTTRKVFVFCFGLYTEVEALIVTNKPGYDFISVEM